MRVSDLAFSTQGFTQWARATPIVAGQPLVVFKRTMRWTASRDTSTFTEEGNFLVYWGTLDQYGKVFLNNVDLLTLQCILQDPHAFKPAFKQYPELERR